eukprot:3209455-Lingulodinium_polyedra.AAC.1
MDCATFAGSWDARQFIVPAKEKGRRTFHRGSAGNRRWGNRICPKPRGASRGGEGRKCREGVAGCMEG